MRVLMQLCAVSVMLLPLCSIAASHEEIQATVDKLVQSVNASVARDVEQANTVVEEARRSAGTATTEDVTIVACTDADGKSRNVQVRGLMNNTVIVNCHTDEDGQPHIIVTGNGTTREIGTVKVAGGAENAVIINERRLGPGSEIVVEGKNARAEVGNVEVKGGKLKNSTIVNRTVVNGKIEAKGEGSSVSVGTVTIGGENEK